MDALLQGLLPLLLSDLNIDLADLRDDRARSVAANIASHGFKDLLPHFRQCHCFHHGTTWWQHCNDEMVLSRCDYILGMDRCMFSNVSLCDPRLFSLDHLMVLRELQSNILGQNKSYLRGRQQFPLQAPK